jgi:hypothetical protein
MQLVMATHNTSADRVKYLTVCKDLRQPSEVAFYTAISDPSLFSLSKLVRCLTSHDDDTKRNTIKYLDMDMSDDLVDKAPTKLTRLVRASGEASPAELKGALRHARVASWEPFLNTVSVARQLTSLVIVLPSDWPFDLAPMDDLAKVLRGCRHLTKLRIDMDEDVDVSEVLSFADVVRAVTDAEAPLRTLTYYGGTFSIHSGETLPSLDKLQTLDLELPKRASTLSAILAKAPALTALGLRAWRRESETDPASWRKALWSHADRIEAYLVAGTFSPNLSSALCCDFPARMTRLRHLRCNLEYTHGLALEKLPTTLETLHLRGVDAETAFCLSALPTDLPALKRLEVPNRPMNGSTSRGGVQSDAFVKSLQVRQV